LWKATVLDANNPMISVRYPSIEEDEWFMRDSYMNLRIFYQTAEIQLEGGETAVLQIIRNASASSDVKEGEILLASGMEFVPVKEGIPLKSVELSVDISESLIKKVYLDGRKMKQRTLESGIILEGGQAYYLQLECQ